MPLPNVVLVTPEEKALAIQTLLDYNDLQKVGATEDNLVAPADRVDNLIVSEARAQQFGQASTPLFLPIDKLDPRLSPESRAEIGMTEQQAVFKQLSDNGVLPMFFSIIRRFIGKLTTDKWVCTTRVRWNYSAPSIGATEFLMMGLGPFPHSSGPGVTGVPVESDPTGNATYVEIFNTSTNLPLVVLGGPNAGQRVYGRTNANNGAVSPTSVNIELVSKGNANGAGDPAVLPNPYTWEAGQPSVINLFYGFRQSLNDLDDAAFRRIFR